MSDQPQPPPPRRQKFGLGRLMITPAAALALDPDEVAAAVRRHAAGDWGELCPADRAANERALRDGSRLFSAYTSRAGVRHWVITESDRSATTVLLPEDY